MGEDVINIEILEDGTIKAETSKISAVNHLLADRFFGFLRELCGGSREVKSKGHTAHVHSHGSLTHSH